MWDMHTIIIAAVRLLTYADFHIASWQRFYHSLESNK
jgi:hypothetical protein